MASLTPVAAFGVKSDIRQNIAYLDEHQFAYVAGQLLVVHRSARSWSAPPLMAPRSTDTKQQKFIQLGDNVGVVTALAVSPNRRALAVAHRGDKATISILDLPTFKKRKVRVSPTFNARS